MKGYALLLCQAFFVWSSLCLGEDGVSDRSFIVDYNLLRARNVEKRIGTDFLTRLYVRYPNFDSAEAVRLATGFERAYARKTQTEIVDEMTRTTDLAWRAMKREFDPKFVRDSYTLVRDVATHFDRDLEDASVRLMGDANAYRQARSVFSVVSQAGVIENAIRASDDNKPMRDALSVYLKDYTGGIDLKSAGLAWDRANPEARAALRGLRNSEGLAKLSGRVDEIQKEILRLRGLARDALARVEAIKPKDARTVPDTFERDMAAYSALNNTLMGLAPRDPTVQFLGRSVGLYLGAAQYYQAFLAGTLSPGGLAAGMLALCVNLALGAGGSDIQTIALSEIRALREDVRRLSEALGKEFSALHRHLAFVAQTIYDRVDRLESFVRYRADDLESLARQHSFEQTILEAKIDEVHHDLFALVSDLADRELTPYHYRLAWKEIDSSTLKATWDRFHACSVRDAQRLSEVGPRLRLPKGADFRHPDFAGELRSKLSFAGDTWGRIGAVADAARAFGFPYPEKGVVNGKLWALCARSYLSLAKKWPQEYLKYDSDFQKLKQVVAVGDDLSRALSSFAVWADGDGKRLLRKAFQEYIEAARSFAVPVDASVREAVAPRINRTLNGIDPFRPLSEQSDLLAQVRPTKFEPYPKKRTFITDKRVWDLPEAQFKGETLTLSDAEAEALEKLIPLELRALLRQTDIRVQYFWAAFSVDAVPAGMPAERCGADFQRQFPGHAKAARAYFKIAIDLVVRVRRANGEENDNLVLRYTHPHWVGPQFSARGYYPVTYHLYDDPKPKFVSEPNVWKNVWKLLAVDLVNLSAKLEPADAKWEEDRGRLGLPKQFSSGRGDITTNIAESGQPSIAEWRAQSDKERTTIGTKVAAVFDKPDPELRKTLDRIDAARDVLLRFSHLSLAPWLGETKDGKLVSQELRALPTSAQLAAEIVRRPREFAAVSLREKSVQLALHRASEAESKFVAALSDVDSGKAARFSRVPPVVASVLTEAERVVFLTGADTTAALK